MRGPVSHKESRCRLLRVRSCSLLIDPVAFREQGIEGSGAAHQEPGRRPRESDFPNKSGRLKGVVKTARGCTPAESSAVGNLEKIFRLHGTVVPKITPAPVGPITSWRENP